MGHKEEIHSSINSSDYKEYLEAINSDLEKIKVKYADPLDGVLKYDENWRCTTFFWDKKAAPNKYLSIMSAHYNASPYYVARLWSWVSKEEIEFKEREIDDIIHQIEEIQAWLAENEVPKSIKIVYLKSLQAMRSKFLMFKNAIWIEWEKSWYKLTGKEREKYHDEVAKLQSKIYWERVSDNKDEVAGVLNKLHKLFNNNKEKLSEEYWNVFENFLWDCDKKYGFHYVKQNTVTKKTEDKGTIEEKKDIDPEKLKKISKHVINFYKNYYQNLEDWNVIKQTKAEALNVSWMREEFWIPAKYENVGDEKVTKVVIPHEIEQHLLQWDNTNRILGKGFSCGWYDFISEWVAKINEDIASGKVNSLKDLKWLKEWASIWLISVFICENYNYDDAVKILTAYYRLSSNDDYKKCRKKAETNVRRRKRFVPYDRPWASVKDTLYQRWKNRVIDYLTEDNSLQEAIERYKELNTFKFWPEELKYIDDIKKELNIEDKDLIYPLFIWRILHDKLQKGKGSINEYLKHFENEEDFAHMKLNPEKLTYATKKQLVEILNLLEYDSKEVNKRQNTNKKQKD